MIQLAVKIRRILVAGVPGSGKSTMIRFFASELKKRGIRTLIVDDFLLLRSLCPEGENKDKYFYDNEILVIDKKYVVQILEDLQKRLSEYWEDTNEKVLILETTNPDLEKFVNRFLITYENSGLIFLNCEMKKAYERNMTREKNHIIPNSYMSLFGNDHETFFEKIKPSFTKSIMIDSTKNNIEEVKKISKKLVADWFNNGFVVNTNRD